MMTRSSSRACGEKKKKEKSPRQESLRLKKHNLGWMSECVRKRVYWMSLRATLTLDFGPQKDRDFDSTASSASPTV